MSNYAISVDWLQVYCTGRHIIPGDYHSELGTFRVYLSERKTKLWNRVLVIKLQEKPCAVICQEPRSPQLNKLATTVKIENRFLYYQGYVKLLWELLKCLSLTYQGLTRLDIALDCNKLRGGMKVDRLIYNYVMKPEGAKGAISRKYDKEYRLTGNKNPGKNAMLTSIRFGTENSRVAAYIYDKSKELQEVKDKPWIRETWQANGLANEDGNHVWRFEISIKAQGRELLNTKTGIIFKLSPDYLVSQQSVEQLFMCYAESVYNFSRCEGQKNKRHYKRLQLWDTSAELTYKPYHNSRNADTGRTEKICYNKLDQLRETYTDMSAGLDHSIAQTMRFLSLLSDIKHNRHQQEQRANELSRFKAGRFMLHEVRDMLNAFKEARQAEQTQTNEALACLYEKGWNELSELDAEQLLNETWSFIDMCDTSPFDEYPDTKQQRNPWETSYLV